MRRVALFAYTGDPMCFAHVLLNALDMNERGYEAKVIIKGLATKLVPQLAEEGNPVYHLYERAKGLDLIDGACKACSKKTGTLETYKADGIRLLDEMMGHPSIGRYQEEGFEIIAF